MKIVHRYIGVGDAEAKLYIWKDADLFTISDGNKLICADCPIELIVEAVRKYLEEM